MDWVVKVGGSLFPENSVKLVEAISESTEKEVMIVCGGGSFANHIRDYNNQMNFSATANHESAIMCMDIVGRLLADKISDAEAVFDLNSAKALAKENKIPILLPSRLMHYLDPLEHSWNVTSDSISCYIAQILQAKLLIATDVDGIYTRIPSAKDAKLINEISSKKLLSFGETSIDTSLSELLLEFGSDCYVVNGKYPERTLSIINACVDVDNTQYTLVRGD